MTPKRIRFIWIFMFFLWRVELIPAATLPQDFLKGIEHYKTGHYLAAIDAFLHITASGVSNGKLFYNLGNAYLKNNDMGHALLWYERALKLMPDDPDLRFNYEYAQSKIKDEREDRMSPILRILFFWKFILGTSTVIWVAIILNFLFWTLMSLDFWVKNVRLKTPAYMILVLTLIFTATAFYNFYETRYMRQAVILPTRVSIRSGLTDESTELFTLHAGSKVKIQKKLNTYYRIYFSEGKIGWIKQSDVGVI